MTYAAFHQFLADGHIVILDGGTGTELERRGVLMDADAWCGAAALGRLDVLEMVHCDYIAAGAEIITTNTFASSPLMLRAAGLGDRFEEINRAAVQAALRAREACGKPNVLVAGSLSHMVPAGGGSWRSDPSRLPSANELRDGLEALAELLAAEGCDLILLEMMHHPDRMASAFEAATSVGLPVWAGFSVRRGTDGSIHAFTQDREIPFSETVGVLADYDIAAAGIMHSATDVTGDALAILRDAFDGPLMAYPDSGYFKMPHWQFEDVIEPGAFRRFAETWVAQGVQVIGGCCGLSPSHIAAIARLKGRPVAPLSPSPRRRPHPGYR